MADVYFKAWYKRGQALSDVRSYRSDWLGHFVFRGEESLAVYFSGGSLTGLQGIEGFLWELLPCRGGVMLNLYFVYNGHCKFYLGSFNNVDELIEQMKDHQWAFSGITRPKFKKHIGKDDVRFDYGAVDCYYLATKSTCRDPR